MFSIMMLVLFALLSTSMTRAHMTLPTTDEETTPSVTPTGTGNSAKVHVNAVAANLPVQTAPITAAKAQEANFPFDLADNLPSVKYTTTPLSQLPQSCSQYTVPTSTSPAECPVGNTMTATNVLFADCGSQFTVCRCDNSSTMSMDDAMSKFAKVPVGLRRYVNTVLLLPDSQPHAYTLTTGDIHMFATTELDTWIHESTHALDYATPGTPLSGSEGWLSALGSDSCVPDTYSQTNAIEDFAQMGVLKIYALAHNGQLPPGFDNQCMKNQLAFMDSLPQYDAAKMFGNTCDFDATGERGGVETGLGAKHSQPPATLDSSIVSPFKSSNTTAASGFKKLPANPNPTVAAAGSDPSAKSSASARSVRVVGTAALASVALAVSAVIW